MIKMKYWWVNHKQTFKAEIDGGYIWSPKENKNGARNETYLNLTRTIPGDVVFSYANTQIQSIGIVAKSYNEQGKPSEFGKAGDAWNDIGWIVPIDWQMIKSPLSPKLHLNQIFPLLPKKNSPIQQNGNGNQSCYLASIPDDLGSAIIELISQNNPHILNTLKSKKNELEDDAVQAEVKKSNIDETEKEQLVKSRRGQGIFRSRLEDIEDACRVTGVSVKNVLVASHMKPWRHSTNHERLDGNNGLLLSPHIDKLFDRGWISFEDYGEMIIANEEIAELLLLWGIKMPLNVGSFNRVQLEYLDYHRQEIFNQD